MIQENEQAHTSFLDVSVEGAKDVVCGCVCVCVDMCVDVCADESVCVCAFVYAARLIVCERVCVACKCK